jgi:hypothetical protein
MNLNTFSFTKLKKKCQNTFYDSIKETLNIREAQTYIPAFSQYIKFNNNFSKKMFIFRNKYIILKLEIRDDTTENINKTLQGNIYGFVVDKKIYMESQDFNAYKNYIKCIPIFIKSNPLLDVVYYMEGKYENNSKTPCISSYITNKKINSINNNAYIEVICAYFLNLLNESKKTSLFPYYFGSFNGVADNYTHDISEDYPLLIDCDWFSEDSDKYEIIRNNNLEEFDDLSFKNFSKIDYDEEKKLQEDINENNASEIDSNIDSDIELENVFSNQKKSKGNKIKNLSEIQEISNLIKKNKKKRDKSGKKIENMDSEDSDSDDYSDVDTDDSDDSSLFSSNASCIMNETFVNIKNFPVQILCMERFDITLTKLVKEGLQNQDWKTILFEVCFGMAVAQKQFSFIHNDLHSDNIMFKSIEKEFKYYYFVEEDKYFKVPTHKRETKVIDFARGILKVGKKTYFSDVFKKDGDAGGQYNYLNKITNFRNKKFNLSFDLARLGTTINEYLCGNIELLETFKFVNSWCIDKHGNNFNNMDDDFSLYIQICEKARNAVPKDQLSSPYFSEFIIEKNEIPKKEHIYIL